MSDVLCVTAKLDCQCPLWVVGSIGRCNTSIKSRSARVSKPKVSRDRSLSCRATRLNCECALPAVPQLSLGHRVEPSNISSTHRPSTPSLASEIKCCVDRLRPPSKADIDECLGHVRFTPKSGHRNSVVECPLCAKSGHRAALFDHFVGDGKNARGHGEAKRFCSL